MQLLPATKARIGEAVAARIQAGQTIVLDAGHTTLEVARSLADIAITVITHSLDIAECLSERQNTKLVLAGGEWDGPQRLFSGPATQRMLSMYRADLAVLGACAIHSRLGVTATTQDDAATKRVMLDISVNKMLVADHTKFNQHESYFVANLDEFDELFTDRSFELSGSRPTLNVISD
jgi:DeoR family glycerol-3-phosphate regulon repressor